jgi:hypothetical protein
MKLSIPAMPMMKKAERKKLSSTYLRAMSE